MIDRNRLDALRVRAQCSFQGHKKVWSHGFMGPVWECIRCGKQGDLEDHSRLSGGEHMVHLGIAVVALIVVWIALKAIF